MPQSASAGLTRYLKTLTPVTELVGAFPADDPVGANAGQPWIFHVGEAGELLVRLEGTSECAIAVSCAGSFQAGTPGSTLQYERLSVEVWADPLRDAGGNVMETSGGTHDRAHVLFDHLDSFLHRREPGDNVVWGDVITVACWRMVYPDFYLVPDGDGMMRGQGYYAVTTSGNIGHVI
jgi:hypothetical protein